MKQCIVWLLSLLVATSAGAEEITETDPLVSEKTMEVFLRAVECLSLHAGSEEKMDFLLAYRKQATYENVEEQVSEAAMARQMALWDASNSKMYKALQKYCPREYALITEEFGAVDEERQSYLTVIFEDIADTVMAAEVLDKETRQKIFQYEYSPVHVEIFPE